MLAINLFFMNNVTAQTNSTSSSTKATELKTYLIERNIPGAGALTPDVLKGISQKSCTVLKEMGPSIVWLHSYVTGDKIFCVYQATNEALLKEHAQKGGFPINAITEIKTTIGPKTAEL